MLKKIAKVISLFAVTTLVWLNGGAQITVSPTRLFFTGDPGTTQTQQVMIRNGSKEDMPFNISLSDWYRDSLGQKVYLPPNTTARSNAGWIKISDNTINIPANGAKEITVTMQIPAVLQNDTVTNSMLMLTQIGKQDDKYVKQNNVGVRVLFEFALHVFYTPKGDNKEDLELTSIRLAAPVAAGAPRRVAVTIQNTGNVISDASVEFQFINNATGDEKLASPTPISMMPGATQTVFFDVPATLKGSYKGVSIVRIGDTNNVKVGEKKLELQ